MNTLADQPFANSPAGYITGIVLPILLTTLLGLFATKAANDRRRWADLNKRLSTQDGSLEQASRALAVMVQRMDDASLVLAQVPGLKAATEVLKSRMDDHDRWATEARREILDNQRHVSKD